jgi:hypothetical protein
MNPICAKLGHIERENTFGLAQNEIEEQIRTFGRPSCVIWQVHMEESMQSLLMARGTIEEKRMNVLLS